MPPGYPQDLADATQELQLARQFALPSQGLPKSVVQECVQDLARTPQELSPIPGGIPKGLVENPQGLCETSKGLSKARAEIHKAFCTTFPRIPEAISRDWTQDVAKIPETLRNKHFPQVSPRILTISPHTLCMSCPRIPGSVARELPGIAAKIPPKTCRDVPSSLTDFPKHSPRKSTKNAPPRISKDSQTTLSLFPEAPQGTRPRIFSGVGQDPRSMCRHPPSTLNNLHKDSSGKSPKNALRVSPNPRKDVARLSSERPMVVTNECPQDTPQDLADATQELQLARQCALRSRGLPKSATQECTEGSAQPSQGRCKTFQRAPNGCDQ